MWKEREKSPLQCVRIYLRLHMVRNAWTWAKLEHKLKCLLHFAYIWYATCKTKLSRFFFFMDIYIIYHKRLLHICTWANFASQNCQPKYVLKEFETLWNSHEQDQYYRITCLQTYFNSVCTKYVTGLECIILLLTCAQWVCNYENNFYVIYG